VISIFSDRSDPLEWPASMVGSPLVVVALSGTVLLLIGWFSCGINQKWPAGLLAVRRVCLQATGQFMGWFAIAERRQRIFAGPRDGRINSAVPAKV
jgi:hypothetical protein